MSSFLGSLPIGLLLVFFPLYLHDLGLRTLLIGGIFTAAGLGSSVLLLAIGPLADRFGRRAFLIAGTALPALGFAIFTLTTNTGWLVVASMLGGVGFSGGLGGALTTATFNPLLAGTVPPPQRTAVMSWSEAVWTSATACGALLAGLPGLLVRARLAPAVVADRAVFVGCFLLIVCGALVLLPVRDRSIHATREEVTARAVTSSRGDGVDFPSQASTFRLKTFRIFGGPFPREQREDRGSFPRSHFRRTVLAVFFALQGAGLGLMVQAAAAVVRAALRGGVDGDCAVVCRRAACRVSPDPVCPGPGAPSRGGRRHPPRG